MRVRKESDRALAFGEHLLSRQLGDLYFLREMDIHEAWTVFRDFADKEWSFTDCYLQSGDGEARLESRLRVRSAFSPIRHRTSRAIITCAGNAFPIERLLLSL